MMRIELDRSSVLQRLMEFEVDYWYDVDFNWGRRADTFYLEDGTFTIGDAHMKGRDAIAQFYSWRERRGARTARHVVTNFHLEHTSAETGSFKCILLLYAADGIPPLPSRLPS